MIVGSKPPSGNSPVVILYLGRWCVKWVKLRLSKQYKTRVGRQGETMGGLERLGETRGGQGETRGDRVEREERGENSFGLPES